MLAVLTFSAAGWAWVVVAALVVLVPLAYWALRPAAPQRRDLAVGLGLRLLGIGVLALCLLDPQWVAPRPKPGANVLPVLADNSQGLQVADRGQSFSRGEELRRRLLDPATWGELEEQYQVRRYTFGDALRRAADFTALDFSEGRSSLGSALRQLAERAAREPIAGVLLLTDGNATDLPDGLNDLAGLPPIYPVVVGAEDGLHDVRIVRTEVRETVFEDAPVSLRVTLGTADEGADDVTVAVQPLSVPGTPPAPGPPPQRLSLRADDNPSRHAEFNWRPTGSGIQFYAVTATSPDADAEATLINNRRVILTDRGRERYRLLYVSGRLNWEFKFLNRALAPDPQLQLVGLLRLALREPKFEFRGRAGEATNPLFRGFTDADDTTRYDEPVLTRLNTRDEAELRGGFPRTAEELFGYDAVIIDDLEAGFFSPDQLLLLRRFVSERGGGLLMLGGVDTLDNGGYHQTALAPALPVHLDGRGRASTPNGRLSWRLTREGWLQPWARVRPDEAAERERLAQMPRFAVANALSAVKPGATVLATMEDESGESYPALVSQPFGRGRVATIGIGDLWRWGLQGSAEQADLARFWRQLSRWLVTDGLSRVELVVDAEQNELELRVSARDAEYRPLESAVARVTVRRMDAAQDDPGFTRAVLPAEPDPTMPGRYVTRFRPREPGAYLAEAEVQERGGAHVGRATAAWVHDPAVEEFAQLTPNRALLENLAQRTGGQVLALDQLGELPDRLQRNPAPVMEYASRPLWHNPWIFLVVLGCFASEWFWRRWRGLP